MKGVQCYELFGGIALKNHAFSFRGGGIATVYKSTLALTSHSKQTLILFTYWSVGFIFCFINKVDKLRANIASEHVTSTLVSGTTAATFSSIEKVSQLTVKECILNSAPKSCELDPIPSKLLIECLDSNLPSLTDLSNSSLASRIFPQRFKSALVAPILKKRCLDHNDLNNYRPVSNLRFIAKILLLKQNRRKEPKKNSV